MSEKNMDDVETFLNERFIIGSVYIEPNTTRHLVIIRDKWKCEEFTIDLDKYFEKKPFYTFGYQIKKILIDKYHLESIRQERTKKLLN